MISFLSRLIDLIAPRACSVCGRRLVPGESVMCAACNRHLPRTHFEDDAYDNEMAQLFWGRIPIERAGALFFYHAQSEVSRMIYALKYGNHPEFGEQLGQMVAEEYLEKGFFQGIDSIIPVPLSRSRQRQRGYNQSMEIARGVSEVTKISILKDTIKRTKFVESQTHKSRLSRAENVEDTFKVLDSSPILNKHILLIDDIVTTGATICACGQALQQSGKIYISVLSLGYSKD